MKRILPLLLCLLLLAGCGSKAPEPETQSVPIPETQTVPETQAPTAPPTVPPTTLPPPPPFHPLDPETQSQLLGWGACCVHEGRYYGNFYENHYHRFGYTDDGGKTWTRLNKHAANHVSLLDGQLYYSLTGKDTGGIYRSNPDGSQPELLLARPHSKIGDAVQYWDGYFYCQDLDNNWNYIRVSKDGGQPETVIPKEVWYPVIHDGWVLYQDDEDTMSLHWFSLETGEDHKLNDTYSFSPFFDGTHIYYLLCDTFDETSSNNTFEIHRMDPDGGNDIRLGSSLVWDMITDGSHIYFTTGEDHLLYRMDMDGSGEALFLDPAQLPEGHPIEVMRMEYGHIILHINMGSYYVGNYVVSMEDGTLLGRF